MVLRAFAEHIVYKHRAEAIHAATLLSSRFFEKEAYTSYQFANYWVRFEYLFWWNNLITSMNSISNITPESANPKIRKPYNGLLIIKT